MNGRLKNNLFLACISMVVLMMGHCRKEDSTHNQSAIFSIPVGVGESSIVPYYVIDHSGNYLFIFLRDFSYDHAKILKVNLATLSVEKEITFNGETNTTVPIMLDNVVLTDNNELIGSFFNFFNSKQLLIKFDVDLNILKVDSVGFGGLGDNGRTRIVKNGPGKISGVFGDTLNNKWFLRYQAMDDNMNILNSVTDTSSFYGSGPLVPENFIKTSDGGYLLGAFDYYSNVGVFEKRDLNFNLLWRTKYNGIDPITLNELNGKYYAYCLGDSLFTLIYDLNGTLLDKKVLRLDGAKVNIDYEPMRKTDNGEFLMVGRLSYNNNPLAKTGILFHADANANVISSQTFGGNWMLGSCLIKIKSNQFLLFYLDNNFKPDGPTKPRFVFRYVDARGNFMN